MNLWRLFPHNNPSCNVKDDTFSAKTVRNGVDSHCSYIFFLQTFALLLQVEGVICLFYLDRWCLSACTACSQLFSGPGPCWISGSVVHALYQVCTHSSASKPPRLCSPGWVFTPKFCQQTGQGKLQLRRKRKCMNLWGHNIIDFQLLTIT